MVERGGGGVSQQLGGQQQSPPARAQKRRKRKIKIEVVWAHRRRITVKTSLSREEISSNHSPGHSSGLFSRRRRQTRTPLERNEVPKTRCEEERRKCKEMSQKGFGQRRLNSGTARNESSPPLTVDEVAFPIAKRCGWLRENAHERPKTCKRGRRRTRI